MRPNSIVNWFVELFTELASRDVPGASGRRTFITIAARDLHRAGCSLRDVQLLAGHCSIGLTQRYIDGYGLDSGGWLRWSDRSPRALRRPFVSVEEGA